MVSAVTLVVVSGNGIGCPSTSVGFIFSGLICAGKTFPWVGFFATGGGTLSDFKMPLEMDPALAGSGTCLNSAAKLCFRFAWASGEEGADTASITTFLELLEKIKLAVDAGDLYISQSSGDCRTRAPASPVERWIDDFTPRREGRPSRDDMAAVFIRMASCRRMEGAFGVIEAALTV